MCAFGANMFNWLFVSARPGSLDPGVDALFAHINWQRPGI
jgi:hypothetical protein